MKQRTKWKVGCVGTLLLALGVVLWRQAQGPTATAPTPYRENVRSLAAGESFPVTSRPLSRDRSASSTAAFNSAIAKNSNATPADVSDRLEAWQSATGAQFVRHKTAANDGTIAFEAVTGTKTFIDRADIADSPGGKLEASPMEIWIWVPGDDPRRLSDSTSDARFPVFSPDGTKLAFTVRRLNEHGIPLRPIIHVVDLEARRIWEVPDTEHVHDLVLIPLEWKNDNELVIYSDHGETRGHARVSSVRFN